MPRDVVLDIIIAKMIGMEYMAGYDAMVQGCRELDAVESALITKGLLREYANAVSKGDRARIARVSGALEQVSKAMELFNYATGQRQVETMRDEKGRFARYITGARSSETPQVEAKRTKGNASVATTTMQQNISNALNAQTNPAAPGQAIQERERGQQLAGKVRAISRFQDELLEVFGANAGDDIVVVVENIPTSADEEIRQEVVGLNAPVHQGALDVANEGPARMTVGLKADAKAESRNKYKQFEMLLNSGLRPDVAADLMGASAGKEGAARGAAQKLTDAMYGYTGLKGSEPGSRAKKHFATMDALGSYFENTKQPQLAAAGTALKLAARAGSGLKPQHYELAERMNYRFRGRKDNLPKTYTDSMNNEAHKSIVATSSEADLSPDTWAAKREALHKWSQQVAVNSTDPRTHDVNFTDPTAAEVSYLNGTMDMRASPRAFVDQFTRDMAVTSLINEVPSDKRAVLLGQLAGYGVPSSGMIIRSDGQSKEMYRGTGDDHYLPFSAKALPELRDGQYVRTRTLGGLTPEDITTLVTSGGRRATVLSGSGLFSVELRPDVSLEGRMKSPEVAAMGERYERILDQVANSGMYIQDLSQEDEMNLKVQARAYAPDTTSQEYKTRYNTLRNQLIEEKSQLSTGPDGDVERITQEVKDSVKSMDIGGGSEQQRARIISDMTKDALETAQAEKVRQLKLNSEGYALALETLRMQYPDIIRRVEHQSLKDFASERRMTRALPKGALDLRNRKGAADIDLVTPGRTRAHPKEWSSQTQADQLPLPGKEELGRRPQQSRARYAAGLEGPRAGGVTGGPAASTTAPAAGTTQAAGAPTTDLGLVRGTMGTQHDKTIADAKAALKGSMQNVTLDPMATTGNTNALKFDKDEHFTEALDSDTRAGFGVELSANKSPSAILLSPAAIERATRTPQGLTMLMSMAYGAHKRGDSGWADEVLAGVPLGSDEDLRNNAAELLDGVASANMLKDTPFSHTPITGKKELGFFIPPDVMARVQAPIRPGGGAEALARVEAAAGDPATPQGQARAAARTRMNDALRNNVQLQTRLLHGEQSAAPMEDLSTLGLLAAQDWAMQEIDRMSTVADDTYGLTGDATAKAAFFNNPALVQGNKDKLKADYQQMFGAEYLRRSLGGGATGPKGLNLPPWVHKEEPLSLQEQVQLLQQWAKDHPLPPTSRSFQLVP
jgi:hypothetical protein